jgi:hypothetical protein
MTNRNQIKFGVRFADTAYNEGAQILNSAQLLALAPEEHFVGLFAGDAAEKDKAARLDDFIDFLNLSPGDGIFILNAAPAPELGADGDAVMSYIPASLKMEVFQKVSGTWTSKFIIPVNNVGATLPDPTLLPVGTFYTLVNQVEPQNDGVYQVDTVALVQTWIQRCQFSDSRLISSKTASFTPAASNATVSAGDGVDGFVVPASWNGMNLVAVTASVHTAGTTGTMDIQIRRRRAGVNADMLSVKASIASAAFTTSTVTIDPNNDDLQPGDIVFVDVDTVHTTPAFGLFVTISAQLPS